MAVCVSHVPHVAGLPSLVLPEASVTFWSFLRAEKSMPKGGNFLVLVDKTRMKLLDHES